MRHQKEHNLTAQLALFFQRFWANAQGSTATIFAIVTPMLLGLGGLVTDYAAVTRYSGRLQTMVDSAALAAAREMTLRTLTNADAAAKIKRRLA